MKITRKEREAAEKLLRNFNIDKNKLSKAMNSIMDLVQSFGSGFEFEYVDKENSSRKRNKEPPNSKYPRRKRQ